MRQWGKFTENNDGIHLTNGEYTLCGDAWDAPDTESDWDAGPFRNPKRHTITCKKCAATILLCRGVHVAPKAT